MPSVDDIRVNAFPTPVYTAAGDVANTCIRVCKKQEELVRQDCGKLAQGWIFAHFNAVYREHDGVLCDASLWKLLFSPRAATHGHAAKLTRAPAAMLTCQRPRVNGFPQTVKTKRTHCEACVRRESLILNVFDGIHRVVSVRANGVLRRVTEGDSGGVTDA